MRWRCKSVEFLSVLMNAQADAISDDFWRGLARNSKDQDLLYGASRKSVPAIKNNLPGHVLTVHHAPTLTNHRLLLDCGR